MALPLATDGPKEQGASASMALKASAPGELRRVARWGLGRLGYLCAGGGKAMFVAAADHSMLPGPH